MTKLKVILKNINLFFFIQYLASQTNKLQERVDSEELHRRIKAWTPMNAIDTLDFPHLSEEELLNLTVGVYQLKLAKSYTAEHRNDDGDYTASW